MLRWIINNYKTLLWAFALSIAVWISAVTSADPDETRKLPYPVTIQKIGQSSDLVLGSTIPEQVEITLRAPSSVWSLLDANPQLVSAILDFSTLSAGEHTSELQIQVNARPVQIIAVTPSVITFNLEALERKILDVDLNIVGEVAIGYQIGDANVDPIQVTVSGPQSKIEQVVRARVSVEVNGIRENLDQASNIELLDADGQIIEGLNVSPSSINVLLPVSQQGGYRDVAVKVTIVGRVASGYRLTDLSVFPPVVTVFSTNPDLVASFPGVIETQALDLQNAQEDITTRLSLMLPEGVSVIGEQTVLVQAGVSPIEGSVTLANELIEIVGLENGFTAVVSPNSVDVILSGPLPLLDTLTRQSIRATVDLTGLTPGTYQMTPKVEILIANIVVESILPNTVEVVISPINPTPTP